MALFQKRVPIFTIPHITQKQSEEKKSTMFRQVLNHT